PRQVEYVFQVVAFADARNRELDHLAQILRGDPHRPADASVQARIVGEGHRAYSRTNFGLDEDLGLVARRGRAQRVTYVERSVRPGGLREVLDRDADARVAL